jgi:hypothetical protein
MSNGSFSGQVTIQKSDRPPNVTITLNGDKADISVGGGGRHGDLVLRDGAGTERIRLQSRFEPLTVGELPLPSPRRILLDGQSGTITMGGNDANGGMNLLNATGTATVRKPVRKCSLNFLSFRDSSLKTKVCQDSCLTTSG